MMIPNNFWGTGLEADVTLNVRYQINHTGIHYRKIHIHGKEHWWHRVFDYLPFFVEISWNELLFHCGYATLKTTKNRLEIKISELTNKILLSSKIIHKAIHKNHLAETIGKQLGALERLGEQGYIEQTADEWTNEVISAFQINRNRNYNDTHIRIRLVPKQIEWYRTLQHKIAEVVPHEWDRPIVEVEISKPESKPTFTCCVGGGCGPKSDAAIITKAVEMIPTQSWDEARIVLFSAPSPMRGIKQLRNLFKLLPWWARAKEFLNRWQTLYENETATYILAGNTVHVHMPRLIPLADNRIQNIVQIITDGIKKKVPDKEVLILGTTEAHKKKLYATLFCRANVRYREVDAKIQAKVQILINRMKEGEPKSEDLALLKDLISTASPGSMVLLACTELPMALKRIPKQHHPQGITIIDSEEVIALQIALSVEKRSTNIQQVNAMEEWFTRTSYSPAESKSL